MKILIMSLLITTLLIIVIVITLNTGDITYNVTSIKGYHYDSGEIT